MAKNDVFDEDRLSRLIELMKLHDLREIDLQEADLRIRLRRNVGSGVMFSPAPFAAPALPAGYAPSPASPTPVAPTAGAPRREAGGSEAEGENIVFIKSPMVGTFYSRPNPNTPPFVKVGDHVDPDKTVCIIEAMKVFNEIPAEVQGRIVALLVRDEEPVEFGKPLFKVDTKGG